MDENQLAHAITDQATSGGLSLLQTVAGIFGIQTAAQRMDEAVEEEFRAWVSEAVIEWNRFRDAWEGREPPSATDIAATLNEIRAVYEKTTTRKKRELLRRALVNAFDPELYEAGYTRRLIRMLDELEYPDVLFLQRLAVDPGGHWIPEASQEHSLSGPVLVRCGLVFKGASSNVPKKPGSTEQVYSAGYSITTAGRAMLHFLREPTDD